MAFGLAFSISTPVSFSMFEVSARNRAAIFQSPPCFFSEIELAAKLSISFVHFSPFTPLSCSSVPGLST